MLYLLFKTVLWLFPMLALLYFFAFCFKSNRRISSSFFFSLFSFLSYMTHIYPYSLKENSCYLYIGDSLANIREPFKWAVVSQYTSSCFRSECYLQELWESLRKEGFDALIVREVAFQEFCSGKHKESLKVFKNDSCVNEPVCLALDSKEVQAYRSVSVHEPIIWLDLKPGETNEASLGVGNIVSLDSSEWDTQREIIEGEVIRLPFEENMHWATLLSRINMTVVHFKHKKD